MHIPDGVLTPTVWIPMTAVSAAGLIVCVRIAERDLDEARIPLAGMMGAFVFAAQMVNFAIPGGTSGHFLGASLLAILLGPYLAASVMACVLAVQCLVFGDGGVTALGTNAFTMAILPAFLAFPFTRWIAGAGRAGVNTGAFLAGWVTTVASAAFCGLMIVLSGQGPAGIIGAMVVVHAVIGVAEGIINAGVLSLLLPMDPSLRPSRSRRAWAPVAVLAAALALAGAVSRFASENPDGLERLLSSGEVSFLGLSFRGLGILPEEGSAVWPALLDYSSVTGVLGVLGLLVLLVLGLRVRGRRRA